MTYRRQRIVVVVLVLLGLTILDVLINTAGKFKLGMVTYIVIVVGFHTLAIEAILGNSRALIWSLWGFVIALTATAFFVFEEWFAAPVVAIFLIVYTIALTSYLRKEFGKKTNDESRHYKA